MGAVEQAGAMTNIPHLRLRPASARLKAIDLAPGQVKTIGRSRQADVVVNEPSLSRVHARIILGDDGHASVEDLGSTNGVFVNGSARRSSPLAAGDRVRFGAIEYKAEPVLPPHGESPLPVDTPVERTILRVPTSATSTKPADAMALASLLATSRELMGFDDLQALLDRVLDRLQPILKPDRSAILLVDPETGEVTPRAVRPARAYASVSEFASETAVREALAARDVLVVHDARLDARLQEAESVAIAGVRSAMCVPLLGRTGPVGALYADKLGFSQSFTPEQVQYASAFASHAAAAIETAQLYEDRERYFRATLEAFAKAIDARDHYTAGHSDRVTAYSVLLARQLGLPPGEIEVIRRAGLLHDIGKVGVPDAVLLKAGPLDPAERAVMESHVTIGYDMLSPLPFVSASLPAIRGHHERWDGRGYPDRLAGTGIHLHARLMAVADSFDAMTSARPYRAALPVEEAARRLRADSGTQFDPRAVEAFDAVEAELQATRGRMIEDPSSAVQTA